MNFRSNTFPHALMAMSLATVAAMPFPSAHASGGSGGGGGGNKTDVTLISTGVEPGASGRAILRVKSASDGRFELRLGGLVAGAPYEVVVGGIRVSDTTTDTSGTSHVRLRSQPRSSHDQLLGFDPRGSVVVIRDAAGDDILAGDLPAGGNAADPTEIACCVPDDKGPKCEDRTADECSAEGGTVSAAVTCMPNPCDTAVVPSEDNVVCCQSDDSSPQCEDASVAECSAKGGIVVAAADCSANPCAAIPAVDTLTQCCTADDSGNECEVRLPSECLARGGVDVGPGSCAVDACAGITVPTGNEKIEVSCELRSSRSKASVSGSGLPDGSYTVHLVSGASDVTTAAEAAAVGEAQFEFDSEGGAGITTIDAAFLSGNPPTVTAQILDGAGNVVLEGSATCRVK